MSAPTLKPGTRCECRDYDCARMDDHNYQHRQLATDHCTNDAIRMVTVPCIIRDADEYGDDLGAKQVPMCEPCAAFHTQKVGVK